MNSYKQAIDLLMNMQHDDFVATCVNLAKHYPATFCKVVPANQKAMFEDEVVKVIKQEGKIHAIKFVRAEKDLSLYDSKTYVEKLIALHRL